MRHQFGGGLEQPMLPSQPPPSTTTTDLSLPKRKHAEDRDTSNRTMKKHRNDNMENSGIASKRKLPGEQQIGVFKIMRSTKGTEGQSAQSQRQQRSTPAETFFSADAGSSKTGKEASKPLSAGSAPSRDLAASKRGMHGGPLRENSAPVLQEPPLPRLNRVDAGGVRDQPHGRANTTAATSMIQATQRTRTPDRQGTQDALIPLTAQETPQIMKNRAYRDEPSSLPSTPSSARRRSSFNMRGKRISSAFSSNGIITLPHSSVSSSFLFKHIDPELPEDDRFRQLLIWVASRAMDSSRSVSNQASSSSLPQLPDSGTDLLKEVQEELIRQLAEKKINIVFEEGGSKASWELKENEQNVRNRAREKLFTDQIEERKKEDTAWAEVAQFYNGYQTSVLSALKKSSRAKGKQRATSQEPEELEPWANELPEAFRGSHGHDVAKEVLEMGLDVGKGDPRLLDLNYKEDRLQNSLTMAQQFVHITELELNHRFSLLSHSLAQRSLPSINLAAPAVGASVGVPALSSYAPLSLSSSAQRTGPDPLELLRAISRTDAARRPVSQMGDAARRAVKDVQRVQQHQQELQRAAAAAVAVGAIGVGVGMGVGAGADGKASMRSAGVVALERKFTDVPPPTPRKPPGTPRRVMASGTTPAGNRTRR